MRRGETVLVLLSGGPDSAAALAWAMRRGPVIPATFDFPGRPIPERRAARRVARAMGLPPPRIIHVPMLRMTGGPGGRRTGEPPGFVPHRNLVYYGLALALAASLGARRIVGGQLKTDGRLFPDGRPAFFRVLNALAARGAPPGQGCRIVLPLARMTKAAAVRLGARLGAPLGLTWSCYRSGRRHCGRCLGCVERREAFRAAGLVDGKPPKTPKQPAGD
jgi:7-cyano-7-deazaguanine synthase